MTSSGEYSECTASGHAGIIKIFKNLVVNADNHSQNRGFDFYHRIGVLQIQAVYGGNGGAEMV